MWFSKKNKAEKTSSALIGGMGALVEWANDKNEIGYFKDGVVYTHLKSEIGSYAQAEKSDSYDFIYDKKIIGSYLPNDSGGLVYIWHSYPTGMELVAEHFSGQKYIFPKDEDNLQTVVFNGDPVGAAAAFVILFYGFGAGDSALRAKFLK